MDTTLPLDTQRAIGEALMHEAPQPNLPVIEFTADERGKKGGKAKLGAQSTKLPQGEIAETRDDPAAVA